jgi:hypothetical protein
MSNMIESFTTSSSDPSSATLLPPEESAEGLHWDVVVPLAATTVGQLQIVPGASRVVIGADPALPELCRIAFAGKAPRVETGVGMVILRYPRHSLVGLVKEFLDDEHLAAYIVLNGSIPWQISVDGGASRLSADLSDGRLAALDIGGGASEVDLALPQPADVVPLRIGGGASRLTTHRPQGVAARLRVHGGASQLTFDAQHAAAIGGEIRWQTPNAEDAGDRYDVEVTGGARQYTLDTR